MTEYIIGADEVGRGCLAGPVTVCAVMVPKGLQPVEGITDSKQLTPGRREALSTALRNHPQVNYALASVPAALIDARGIVPALVVCFRDAVGILLQEYPDRDRQVTVQIDGLPLSGVQGSAPTEYIVDGDCKVWAIGAASIIAKVSRDRFMADLASKHPEYKWDQNKGYGTADHQAAILRHGLTPYHRVTFCRGLVPDSEDVLDLFDWHTGLPEGPTLGAWPLTGDIDLTTVPECPILSDMKKDQQIKVNLERDVKDWLIVQAAERHCSISQVVLELILKAMKTK